MILTLYKECKLKMNDVIEKVTDYDIMTYLSTLESETIDNINLNKHIFDDIVLEIKLNKKLKDIDVYSFNYAMIEYNDNKYYYFIANKEWVADSTTKLLMYLDTCNTYEYRNNIITDTSKWRRANVLREHRDRFTKDKLPIIDKMDEGFGTLPMNINKTELLNDSTGQYYLGYYKAKDENSRSVCKVFKDTGEDKTRVWYNASFKLGDILSTDGTTAILLYVDVNDTFVDFNATPNDYTSTSFLDNKNLNFIYFNLYATGMVHVGLGYWLSSEKVYLQYTHDISTETLEDFYSSKTFKMLKGARSGSLNNNKAYSLTELLGSSYTTEEITSTAGLNFLIPQFSKVLKADSNILKVIEIPYFEESKLAPYYDFAINSIIGSINSEYINTSFDFNTSYMYSVSVPDVLYGVKHSSEYETKLLGSQFTLNQFKYDSFNYNINLEDLDLTETSFKINAITPVDMSTSIAFKFNYNGVERSEFDRWLITQRNNQVPTMTNEYLEYMQNGYNYDVKNRNIQSGMNWASFIGNLASGGLMLGANLSASKESNSQLMDLVEINQNALLSNVNYLDKHKGLGSAKRATLQESINEGVNSTANAIKMSTGVAGAISMGNIANSIVGTVGTLANNIIRDVQSRNAIEQRKKDYLNSAVNVSNADELTLFHLYNGANKLRYSQYKLEDTMLNSVYELMRFTGYATNQWKIPNLKSRTDYNFIQAVVEYKGDYFIPETMFNAIVDNLASGVTIFHRFYNGTNYIYDLDREYENWESVLTSEEPTPTPPTEIKDLTTSATTVLNADGTFKYVSYSITNPNDFKVKCTGTFKVDDTIIAQDWTMTSGEAISGNTIVDGLKLELNVTLTKGDE